VNLHRPPDTSFPVAKNTALVCWVILMALLLGLPALARWAPGHALEIFDSFFRAGSLVFGGGHVVLPLLRSEVVPARMGQR